MNYLSEIGIGYALLIGLAIYAVLKGLKTFLKLIIFVLIIASIAFAYLYFA